MMSTVDRSQIQELINQSDALERGVTQIALLEEAVRLADLLADIPLAYQARTKLIEAGEFGGADEKSLVAFSWCLAQLDRNPGLFDEHDLLWRYKWVIDGLSAFPQISRDQIQTALADLARRIERGGYGMRPVYKLQFTVAQELGDESEIHEAHDRWARSSRSQLSDCSACDLHDEVEYLFNSGRPEEALEQARPIFEGRSRCNDVPAITLSRSLLPLIRMGRFDEAVSHHRKGYRLIAGNRYFLTDAAQHLVFLALTDNLVKGIKLIDAHFPWSLATFDQFDRFNFSLATLFLLERLEASGKSSVKLRLPSNFVLYEASGKQEIAPLKRWLEADAIEIGRKFDARNGNEMFARKIKESRELGALVRPTPLRAQGKGTAE